MLKKIGIKDPEKQMLKLMESGAVPYRGVKQKDVRNALEERFEPQVLKSMTDEASLAKRYPGVPHEEAAYREMRRLTDELNSSDKGNLVEDWYERMYAQRRAGSSNRPESRQHQKVSAAEWNKNRPASEQIKKDRFIDRVDSVNIGGKEKPALHEIKSTKGKLQERDKEQFEDMMKVAKAERNGVEARGADGRMQKVDQVVYTLTDPRGVAKNEDWIVDQLTKYKNNLSFEVFDAQGKRMMIDARSLKRSKDGELVLPDGIRNRLGLK